jgi:glycosyltransferase involved in cell wall biosynthesis
MTRPKILAACAELPWPIDSGHKLVSLNDLRYLSESFDIDALNLLPSRVSDEELQVALDALRELLPAVQFHEPVRHDISGAHSVFAKGIQLLRSFAAGIPYIISKYRNREYSDRVRDLITQNKYSAIFVESTPLSFLFADVPEIFSNDLPVIFRAHDMLSETIVKFGAGERTRISSIVARIEAKRTRKFEEHVWHLSTIIAPVTQRLTTLIGDNLGDNNRSKMLYLPVVTEMKQLADSLCNSGSGLVLYVGTVHYPPNLQGLRWFLDHVWPDVIKLRPDARFRVIGKGGHLLAKTDISVEILDYVENLDAHYSEADALIVPLFSGSGIRLKILESFARGIPVISTTEGYLGLDVTPGEELLAADEPSLFANEIIKVLGSSEERTRLRKNSMQFIQCYHGVEGMRGAIKHIGQRLLLPIVKDTAMEGGKRV